MKKTPSALALMALLGLLVQGVAAGPGAARGGSRYVVGAPTGAYVHGGYRHSVYPGGRYGWYGGYWGPSVGIYYRAGLLGWLAVRVGLGVWIGYPTLSADRRECSDRAQSTSSRNPNLSPRRAPPTSYWYCTQPAGYFPHVQGCSHLDESDSADPG
jgi:hypothetical protein